MMSTQILKEKVKTPFHDHSLIHFTRFTSSWCRGCGTFKDDYASRDGISPTACNSDVYIYGGYRCNEPECDDDFVLHKECAKPLQEINHYSHRNHPLKLTIFDSEESTCSFCLLKFNVGYCCSVCDFKLDLVCARRPEPLVLPANSYGHKHQLKLVRDPTRPYGGWKICKVCPKYVNPDPSHYRCHQCEFVIHVDCVDFFQEAYHSSHPQHPLKSLKCEVPDYADGSCLLCEKGFDGEHYQLHHCDVCNFSICRACMKNPPPLNVESLTTHEHRLHLFPRLIDFTCNACGTRGNRSPYFCLPCNFMIHRQCIDLPRVININRHDHRISYTRRVGHGEWKCRVCRKKVDGFYGAYTCAKCPTFVVHALCATNEDVWDMVEREGTPEEEEIAPFEVIDDITIKHFSHEHNLQINNKDDGKILHDHVLCKACVFQICSEPFYSCEQCDFILHQKCANLPRKKRHMLDNKQFILHTDSRHQGKRCWLCGRRFTGFTYESNNVVIIDVRCASLTDSLEHESHPHPLYYNTRSFHNCSQCWEYTNFLFRCDEFECDYVLDGNCALLPKKVMGKRYDDHPLFLAFGDEKKVDGEYWCEACEKKVNPKRWFYTCNDCGITLHIFCVVGDFSYLLPGSLTKWGGVSYEEYFETDREVYAEVVSNTSICRLLCYRCNTRCKLPSILKLSKVGDDVYICSLSCLLAFKCIREIKE